MKSFWTYLLIEFGKGKNKRIELCEVFFRKNKPWACASLDWNDLKESYAESDDFAEMIIGDIAGQLKNKDFLTMDDFEDGAKEFEEDFKKMKFVSEEEFLKKLGEKQSK